MSLVYRIKARVPTPPARTCAACGLAGEVALAGFCDDLAGCCYRADIRVRHAYGPGGDPWHWTTFIAEEPA